LCNICGFFRNGDGDNGEDDVDELFMARPLGGVVKRGCRRG